MASSEQSPLSSSSRQPKSGRGGLRSHVSQVDDYAPHQPLVDQMFELVNEQPPADSVKQRALQVHTALDTVLNQPVDQLPSDSPQRSILQYLAAAKQATGLSGAHVLYSAFVFVCALLVVSPHRALICNVLAGLFPAYCVFGLTQQPDFVGAPKWLCVFWGVFSLSLLLDGALQHQGLVVNALYWLPKFTGLLVLQLCWFRFFERETWFHNKKKKTATKQENKQEEKDETKTAQTPPNDSTFRQATTPPPEPAHHKEPEPTPQKEAEPEPTPQKEPEPEPTPKKEPEPEPVPQKEPEPEPVTSAPDPEEVKQNDGPSEVNKVESELIAPIVVEGEKQVLIPTAPVTEEAWQDSWQDIDVDKSDRYRVRFGIPALNGQELKGFEGQPMGKSNVALWYQHGQPVMGAIWNDAGTIRTNFGWGGHQYTEHNTRNLQIITYHPRMSTFEIGWVAYQELIDPENDWSAVKVADCAPCVITDYQGREWLGKVLVSEEKASYPDNKKEVCFVGPQVKMFKVLCKRPKQPGRDSAASALMASEPTNPTELQPGTAVDAPDQMHV